jgi:hypothetical protein
MLLDMLLIHTFRYTCTHTYIHKRKYTKVIHINLIQTYISFIQTTHTHGTYMHMVIQVIAPQLA